MNFDYSLNSEKTDTEGRGGKYGGCSQQEQEHFEALNGPQLQLNFTTISQ